MVTRGGQVVEAGPVPQNTPIANAVQPLSTHNAPAVFGIYCFPTVTKKPSQKFLINRTYETVW